MKTKKKTKKHKRKKQPIEVRRGAAEASRAFLCHQNIVAYGAPACDFIVPQT